LSRIESILVDIINIKIIIANIVNQNICINFNFNFYSNLNIIKIRCLLVFAQRNYSFFNFWKWNVIRHFLIMMNKYHQHIHFSAKTQIINSKEHFRIIDKRYLMIKVKNRLFTMKSIYKDIMVMIYLFKYCYYWNII
jgi:hypothetical protein